MTKGEILIQILHEVTGRPTAEVSALITHMEDRFPGKTRLRAELSPEASQQLMDALRQEQSGILNWLIEGRKMAMQHSSNV